MHVLLKVAYRNLVRNSKRNKFTVLSIACGFAFLFWMKCILAGHNANMVNTVTSSFTGKAQIHKKGYLADRALRLYIDDSDISAMTFKKDYQNWSERVYFPSIASAGLDSYPIILTGINAEREGLITQIPKQIVKGKFINNIESCELPPLNLSTLMAEKLDVDIDDKVVFMGQDATGSLGNNLFLVAGLFESTSSAFDRQYAFTNLNCAKEISAISGVHEVIFNEDNFNIKNATEEVTMSSWKDVIPGVANMIKFNKAISLFITFILFSVITLGVVNSILMNIHERTREIGVMLALGTYPWQLQVMILMESFFLAIMGVVLGTVVGLVVVKYHQVVPYDISLFLAKDGASATGFNFPTLIRPIIDWSDYIFLSAIEIIFITLSGVFPAVVASRITPIETIRG